MSYRFGHLGLLCISIMLLKKKFEKQSLEPSPG